MPRVLRIALFIGAALAGFFLVIYITAPYGPGISADSVDYIAAADNLVKNAQLIGYDGSQFLSWPPLFPFILAGLSLITGLDIILIGRFLNAVCFGGIIALSGILFQRNFNNSVVWFFLGAWLSFTSFSLLALSINITSDPLFIALVLCYAVIGSIFLENPESTNLFGLAIIAAITALLRWNGAIVISSTIILTYFAYRKNPRTALLKAVVVAIIASLPMLIWVFGRNLRLYNSLMGIRDIAAINIQVNLIEALTKISHWFIPQELLALVNPLLLIFLLILLLIYSNPGSNWRAFFQHLKQPIHIPWLIFTPIYFVFVISTSIPYDHPL